MADYRVGAARDLPLDEGGGWEGSAAQAAIFEWAGWPDQPDPAKAKKGFLVYDASAAELKGSYSLPFATVKSGQLTALAAGIRAAASRLPQKDGLSTAVQNEARAVIDAYEKRMGGKGEHAQPLDGEYFGRVDWFPVPVLPLSERAGNALPDEELLSLAKQRAQDPAIFDEFPPTFFSGIASTSKLDSYSTHMHGSSLRNFADDLTEGRVLLDSHDNGRLGIGYSLRGQFTGAGGNGVMKAAGDWFSAPTSDDATSFIRKMKAGMVRDLSGGFYGGQWLCDLCGQDMMGGMAGHARAAEPCPHWPGMTYEQAGKPVMATAAIHNARLAEVSAVYDGATPGAMILRARQMSEAGLIVPETARLLEVQYRIRLPASHRTWAGGFPRQEERHSEFVHTGELLVASTQREEASMPDKEGQGAPVPSEPPAPLVALRSLLTEAGLTVATDPFETVRAVTAELLELRPLKEEVARLRPLADMGTKYHADERDRAIEEGIRAQGAAFPAETFKGILERASLTEVQTLAAGWQATADAKLAGGRISTDTGEPDPAAANGKTPASQVPVGAYAG